jgi:hypothetical protein
MDETSLKSVIGASVVSSAVLYEQCTSLLPYPSTSIDSSEVKEAMIKKA